MGYRVLDIGFSAEATCDQLRGGVLASTRKITGRSPGAGPRKRRPKP